MRTILTLALLSCLAAAPAVAAVEVYAKDAAGLDAVRAEFEVRGQVDAPEAGLDPAGPEAPTLGAWPGAWRFAGWFWTLTDASMLAADAYAATGLEVDPEASLVNPVIDTVQHEADAAAATAVEAAPESAQPTVRESYARGDREADAVLDEGANAKASGRASQDGTEVAVAARAGAHSVEASAEAAPPSASSASRGQEQDPVSAPEPARHEPSDEAWTSAALPAAVAPAFEANAKPVNPVVAAVATVTLVLGSAGAAFVFVPGWRTAVWKFLQRVGVLALFSRIAQSDILNHERRSYLLEFVKQNPGERVEVARRALGFSNGSMHYHLRVLQARNLLRVHKVAGCARLFVAGPRVQPTPYVPARRKLFLEVVTATPGLTQRDVARRLNLSERMVSYHVRTLTSQGLLEIRADGFRKRLFVRSPPPLATSG